MNTNVESLVIGTLQDVGKQQIEENHVEISNETALFGRDGILDSIGLVTLVVAVEQAIENEYGMSISLADEKALSQKYSPYKTVRSLAEYADRLIRDNEQDG